MHAVALLTLAGVASAAPLQMDKRFCIFGFGTSCGTSTVVTTSSIKLPVATSTPVSTSSASSGWCIFGLVGNNCATSTSSVSLPTSMTSVKAVSTSAVSTSAVVTLSAAKPTITASSTSSADWSKCTVSHPLNTWFHVTTS